jgi:hypothetical protein
MAKFTFELVLGDDQATFFNLIASLPPGQNNLARGVVVPSHPTNQPPTFKVGNLSAGIPYVIDIEGEWQAPPTPRIHFVPVGTTHNVTVALPYGPVSVTVRDPVLGDFTKFLLSVVNYATLFRSYAREITEYSKIPLNQLEDSIASPLSYRLATPMLSGLTSLIPADLEILASLSHKLLIKSLLHTPGTFGATNDILAAFSASNPVFFQMQNINKLDSPLFRSEEVFQGYEAHVWLPNREIERWKAFIQLLNNLPQLYTLKQITEGEVYVEQGGKIRRHFFDFESPLANSITTGLAYLTECFLRLFSLTVAVESEHFLAFCQASYILDQLITNALSPTDADPLGIEPWQDFSLSGRFGQQYDIMPYVHEWYYDSPLKGEVDGVNRFFGLHKFPIATSAVKVFVDGLLKRLYVDYRVSLSGSIISSAYRVLAMPTGPLIISTKLGYPRPFLGPVFSSLECRGGANLQMILTGIEQGLDRISFIISHMPNLSPIDPQAIAVHFATPKLPNTGNVGENQYGQIAMTAGISSYVLTYNQPTASIDYQLLISFTVEPMPSTDPTLVDQIFHLVREHTQTGATIEFSAPLGVNVYLNWWVIEDDSLTLERGTLPLADGSSQIPIVFANGPYFDQVVVLLQLWETYPTFVDAGQYLAASIVVGPGGTTVKFSAPIKGSNYRLDYAIFPARDGDFVEFFEPPIGLIEAHYDVKWPHWVNAALSPAPDGIRTAFSLPAPVANPKSVYIALDGRLMTQGADKQYTIANDQVIFTFPPTFNQSIWSVYPVNKNAEILPSAWEQGFLNYLPADVGEFATGWIRTTDSITVGSFVDIDGLMFMAVATAQGTIVNGNIISVGSSVKWGTLGITLTAVPDAPTSITEFKVGVSKDADTAALVSAINAHPILNLHYLAVSNISGFITIKAKRLGGGLYNELLVTFGSLTATNIIGDTAPSSYNSRTIYLGEHVVSVVSDDVNTTTSTFYRQSHPYYEGLGVTAITTNTLPSPLTSSELYYVTNITADTFQLSLTPYGTPITLATTGVGYHTFTSVDVEVATSTFAFPTSTFTFTANTTLNLAVITGLSPFTADLVVGMAVAGTGIPADAFIISVDSLTQITLNANVTATQTASTVVITNVFQDQEPVGFLTKGSLPSGLGLGATYYVRNITENRFQVSSTLNGPVTAFTDGGIGEFVVYSIPRFAAGCSQTLDTQALATEIGKHPITAAKVVPNIAATGLITLTATELGVRGNLPVATNDETMSTQNLAAGKDPEGTLYGSSKVCYYYNAPVTTLDGLSTRLWKQYHGDKFVFDYPPTLKQESYFISEVYPVDYHPLDSTIANLPCNYPKGIFTQGFGTHFNKTDIAISQPGSLVIATANLPVQERPIGNVNGVNTIFNLSLESCAGQNSLMLWIDGIFQPTDKYTYTDMGTYGRITFLAPPATGQEIWAWYLPYGAACIDERVRELVGTIDGSNQTFTVPDAPWADIPAIVVYLEGLFILQDQDYAVLSGNTQIQFLDGLVPMIGQSLWAHYNLGTVLPVDNWRQVFVAMTNGTTSTFMIPHMLLSELPTSTDSVLAFLNGVNQGGHFSIEVDSFGNPTGNIIFDSAPEANRRLEVAYIR